MNPTGRMNTASITHRRPDLLKTHQVRRATPSNCVYPRSGPGAESSLLTRRAGWRVIVLEAGADNIADSTSAKQRECACMDYGMTHERPRRRFSRAPGRRRLRCQLQTSECYQLRRRELVRGLLSLLCRRQIQTLKDAVAASAQSERAESVEPEQC